MRNQKNYRLSVLLTVAVWVCVVPARAAEPVAADLENHIREMVREMLSAKDAEIEGLKQRVRELERIVAAQPAATTADPEHGAPVPAAAGPAAPGSGAAAAPAGVEATPAEPRDGETAVASAAHERRISEQLGAFKKEVEGMIEGSAKGLDIFGFMDATARTENTADSTFDINAIEVDLEYQHSENFGAAAGLVWDGSGSAEIGVGFADYHFFDHRVPARGRIFSAQGFHLQAGRFDIPFGTDYLYFAAPDRPNVSAPLTTERIQDGGFNGDGVRAYGTWKRLDYTAYWTDSVYAEDGTNWGGRLGLSFGRNPYRLHQDSSPRILDFGVSALLDFDRQKDLRNEVYGVDVTFSYGSVQVVGEAATRDAHHTVFDGNGFDLGEPDQQAWHVWSTVNLERYLELPVSLYAGYGRWNADYSFVVDADDDTVTYRVEDIPRATLGIAYHVADFLRLKLEYQDSLGHETEEPGFEERVGTAQMVVQF